MSKRFFDKENYNQNDLEELISNEIEESLYLDYKSGKALDKTDKKKFDVAKHVSAFANSDGGIIIYGILEVDHKPKSFDFVDGEIYSKEWLENVIDGNIQQRIHGLEIIPIRFNQNIKNSIYLIKIPRSYNAPHLSPEKIYYRRFNFKSVPMEEYEIRLLYSRKSYAELDFDRVVGVDKGSVNDENDQPCLKRELHIHIKNISDSIEMHCKIEAGFQNIEDLGVGFSYDNDSRTSHRHSNERIYVITSYNDSPIFPEEEFRILKFMMTVRKNKLDYFKQNAVLELKLFDSTTIKTAEYNLGSFFEEKGS